MPAIPWDTIIAELRRYPSTADATAEAPAEAVLKRDPFHVLVSTMISLRTKDEVTGQASARLLRRAGTPAALRRVPEAEIARLIYPAGFYHNKARHLKEMAALVVKKHAAKVPSAMDELLSLPGVGRKTANLVRNLGFGLPGICVDTHVHRISNRLGWVHTANPHETEEALMKILPQRYWIMINQLLVSFGQQVCTPVSPHCTKCPIRQYCQRIGVTRFR